MSNPDDKPHPLRQLVTEAQAALNPAPFCAPPPAPDLQQLVQAHADAYIASIEVPGMGHQVNILQCVADLQLLKIRNEVLWTAVANGTTSPMEMHEALCAKLVEETERLRKLERSPVILAPEVGTRQ